MCSVAKIFPNFDRNQLQARFSRVTSGCHQITLMKTTHSLAVFRVFTLLVLLKCSSSTSFGQGTVNFSMVVTGELATRMYQPNPAAPFFPVFGNSTNDIPIGTQPYGWAFLRQGDLKQYFAQLWAAPGANQPDSALQPASGVVTVGAGGRVGAGVITVSGIPAELPVATFQIRVWQQNDGFQSYPTWPNWTQVSGGLPGGYVFGKSARFNVEAIGGGTNPPPNLANFRSFSTISYLFDRDAAPLVYVQPQSKNVAVGGSVTLRAETALPAPNDINWRFNGTNIAGAYASSSTNAFAFPMVANAGGTLTLNVSDDLFLAFAATNALQLTNVQPAQAGLYSLVVTNYIPLPGSPFGPGQFTISSNAVLTVGSPGELKTSNIGSSGLVLNWDGVFILQSATSIEGPYVDLPGPVIRGPFTNSDFSGQKFFRLRN